MDTRNRFGSNFPASCRRGAVVWCIGPGDEGVWRRSACGTIEAVVFDPNNSSTIYVATRWSGIFKSTDRGETWTAINAGLTDLVVDSLAIPPSDNATIYAGTRSGVFKSVNGGSTWRKSLPQTYTSVVDDPVNAKAVYAVALAGVFKNTIGTRNWIPIPSRPRKTQPSVIEPLAVDPSRPTRVYAAAGDRGLLRSSDGGRRWKIVRTQVSVDRVWVGPSGSPAIYVLSGGQVLKSADAGEHWNRAESLPQTYRLALAFSPQHPGTIYAGSFEGRVFKSTNWGESWTGVAAPTAGEIKVLLIDPIASDTIYAGTLQGILKSTDAGRSWGSSNAGITSSNISAIAIAPSQPATLYVGAFGGGVARSSNGGETWMHVNTGLATDDVYTLAVDPFDAAKVYAGTFKGVFKSTDGGTSWVSPNRGLPEVAICSLLIDRSNPAVLYATASSDGKAFKSTNAGDNWDELRFGFPRLGGCGVVMNPVDPSILYATSDAGAPLKSIDAGKSWQKDRAGASTFARLWRDTTSLAVDPDSKALYAASSAGVFQSTDQGNTWSVVSTTAPTEGLVRLLLDPVRPNFIYAEAEFKGLFKSTDRGHSWRPINSGLPDLGERDLVIDSTDSSTLYVGTKQGVFRSTNGGESWLPTGSKEKTGVSLPPKP